MPLAAPPQSTLIAVMRRIDSKPSASALCSAARSISASDSSAFAALRVASAASAASFASRDAFLRSSTAAMPMTLTGAVTTRSLAMMTALSAAFRRFAASRVAGAAVLARSTTWPLTAMTVRKHQKVRRPRKRRVR